MALANSTWPRDVSVQPTGMAGVSNNIERSRRDHDLEGSIPWLQHNGELPLSFLRVLERMSPKIPKVKKLRANWSLSELLEEGLGRDQKNGLRNLAEKGPRKVPEEDARNLRDQQKGKRLLFQGYHDGC